MLGLKPHFRRRLTEFVVLSISFAAQLGFGETNLSKSCGSLLFPAQRYVSPITDQDRTLSVSRRKGQSFTDEQAHIVHTRDFFIQLMDSKKAFAIYELYVGGEKISRILFMTDWIDPVYDSAHEVIHKGVEKILISYPLDVSVDLRLLTKGYLRPTESGAEVYELASGKIYAYQGAMGSTLSREAQLIKSTFLMDIQVPVFFPKAE